MQCSRHWIAVVWRPLLAGVVLLAMSTTAAAQPATGQDSPIAALEAMKKAILEAKSLADVLPFYPQEMRDMISELPPEQQVAGLEQEKRRIGREKYVAERIDGDNGVVVSESTSNNSPKGVRFIKMARADGAWRRTEEEEYIIEALRGSNGTYSVSDAVSSELENGIISLLVTTIEIADLATENLGDGMKVARVLIPFNIEWRTRCFDAGEMAIGTVVYAGDDGNTYTINGGFAPAGTSIEQGFYRDMTGTLDVVPGEGDRFSGSYELTASNDAGETVTVSGSIEGGLMPCSFMPKNDPRRKNPG